MPLHTRRTEPIELGRKYGSGDTLVKSKEECVNRTLSNIIRQLSTLGKYAVDIFQDLEKETESLGQRTKLLMQRSDKVEENLNVSCFKTMLF